MVKNVKIFYTSTFENTTDNLIAHLSEYTDEIEVIGRVQSLIELFESRVSVSPYSCQRSQSLASIGISQFREYNLNGFRLLYQVTESEDNILIISDLLLLQKQDVERALVDYCLFYL